MKSILIILILVANGDQLTRPVIDHIEFDTEQLCEVAATEFKRTVERDYQQEQLRYIDPEVIVTAKCVAASKLYSFE